MVLHVDVSPKSDYMDEKGEKGIATGQFAKLHFLILDPAIDCTQFVHMMNGLPG